MAAGVEPESVAAAAEGKFASASGPRSPGDGASRHAGSP